MHNSQLLNNIQAKGNFASILTWWSIYTNQTTLLKNQSATKSPLYAYPLKFQMQSASERFQLLV